MPPTKHHNLGASSAKRWMSCPGSVKLAAQFPQGSSKFADEGSLAHALAENLIQGKKPTTAFKKRVEAFYDKKQRLEKTILTGDIEGCRRSGKIRQTA